MFSAVKVSRSSPKRASSLRIDSAYNSSAVTGAAPGTPGTTAGATGAAGAAASSPKIIGTPRKGRQQTAMDRAKRIIRLKIYDNNLYN